MSTSPVVVVRGDQRAAADVAAVADADAAVGVVRSRVDCGLRVGITSRATGAADCGG